MQIRPFQEADRAAVIQLWQDCGLTVPWNDPNKDIDRKCQVGADLFLVGETNGKLIASVMGGYEGHRGWVNYLAVDPNHQGQGHAKQLMHTLEQKLITLGCPKINLQVRSTNTRVMAFYDALGYQVDAAVSLGKRLISDQP
ncbi:GNAT family acetyltransferase [Saccharospirillum sp. MSK14-1]|uniref:GNAT family acetyltransferase n=1 Tax=Saccharospirillum sp. MSK14-1 TaxID=1897632 RepID=UPI000D3BF022|nr:GNAT family acetyltransferase [Saccharospirillum sp. MSK14-1]PTY38801.1 GNAT family acetyltransferase [Saccharospirillum sp. MSK14-1]